MTATLSMMSLSNSTVPSTGVESNFCVTLHSVKLQSDTTGSGFNLGLQVALFYGRQLLCDMLSHSVKYSPNNGSTSIAVNKTFQFDLGCNSINN